MSGPPKPRRVALMHVSPGPIAPIGTFPKISPSLLGSKKKSRKTKKKPKFKVVKGIKDIREKIKQGKEPSARELDILQKRIKKRQQKRFLSIIEKFEKIAKKEEKEAKKKIKVVRKVARKTKKRISSGKIGSRGRRPSSLRRSVGSIGSPIKKKAPAMGCTVEKPVRVTPKPYCRKSTSVRRHK